MSTAEKSTTVLLHMCRFIVYIEYTSRLSHIPECVYPIFSLSTCWIVQIANPAECTQLSSNHVCVHAGDPDEWEKVIKVNMLSPMRLMRRLTPAMVERGEGVIINIDSSAGLSPKPGNAVYSSSK